jgi:hypothetical protein
MGKDFLFADGEAIHPPGEFEQGKMFAIPLLQPQLLRSGKFSFSFHIL